MWFVDNFAVASVIYKVLDTEATPTKLVQTRNVSVRILPNFSLNFLWISSRRLWAPSFIADPDRRGHFLWWNDISTNQDPYFDIHSHSWAVFQNRLTQASRTRGRPVWQLVLVAVPSPPCGSHVNSPGQHVYSTLYLPKPQFSHLLLYIVTYLPLWNPTCSHAWIPYFNPLKSLWLVKSYKK